MDKERRNPFFAEPKWQKHSEISQDERGVNIKIDRIQNYEFEDGEKAKEFFEKEIKKYTLLSQGLRAILAGGSALAIYHAAETFDDSSLKNILQTVYVGAVIFLTRFTLYRQARVFLDDRKTIVKNLESRDNEEGKR